MKILTLKNPEALKKWLVKNHSKSTGVWIRFYKKASGKKGLTYAEALDVALCYGWIDSLVNKYDADSYIQKFSPRGPKSVWSKRNREHVARLIREKRMTPHGLRHVAAAKKDGRWSQAYDGPATMKIPADFLREIGKDKKAKTFFATLNRANVFAIGYRLQTAKTPETLARRKSAILSMLAAGKKFH